MLAHPARTDRRITLASFSTNPPFNGLTARVERILTNVGLPSYCQHSQLACRRERHRVGCSELLTFCKAKRRQLGSPDPRATSTFVTECESERAARTAGERLDFYIGAVFAAEQKALAVKGYGVVRPTEQPAVGAYTGLNRCRRAEGRCGICSVDGTQCHEHWNIEDSEVVHI